MGTERDESGITLQQYDDRGFPHGDPIFGKYTHIAGKGQGDITKGAALERDEIDMPGSADWLTLIAIADSSDKLEELLRNTTVSPLTASQSSHSSRRVLIEVDVNDVRQTFRNRITVASGPILSLEPDDIRIKVAHVKVLPEGAELREGHPLFKEFKGGLRAAFAAKK